MVPDLREIVDRYVKSTREIAMGNKDAWDDYDKALNNLSEQMVRDGLEGPPRNGWRGHLKRLIRGGRQSAEERHRWMYDDIGLIRDMKEAGFGGGKRVEYNTSGIEGWSEFYLDQEPDGTEYKPASLYVEGGK